MTPEELCQLADDELRLGIADPALWQRANQESNGIHAVAIQAYWRLRSDTVRSQAARLDDAAAQCLYQDLQARVDNAARREGRHVSAAAWAWIGIFFLSVFGDFEFVVLAGRSMKSNGAWFYVYSLLGVVSLIATGQAIGQCKRLQGARTRR